MADTEYTREQVLQQARDALQKTMAAWGGTCAWHADVKAAIAAIDAASPASKSAGGGGERDARKPWERTDWTCARARVDSEGMHCPKDKCPDCPKRLSGPLGTSPDQQEQPR